MEYYVLVFGVIAIAAMFSKMDSNGIFWIMFWCAIGSCMVLERVPSKTTVEQGDHNE